MWFSGEILHKIAALEKDREELLKQIPIYEQGIEEEIKNLDLLMNLKQELEEALSNFKQDFSVVLMNEYKYIIIDIRQIAYKVLNKEMVIYTLKKSLAEKRKQIENITDSIQYIKTRYQLGKILPFRRNA